MVEQENSQASPAFPDPQDSSAKIQNAFYNPWFMIESTSLLNEKPLYSSDVDGDENYYASHDALPQEVSLHDSSLDDKCSKVRVVTKLDGWSQPSSEMFPATSDPYFEANSPLSFWGACPLDLETMKIDDVFQVDKDDLVQSPTLAELNANDESLFDSFDCFDDFQPFGDKTTLNKQLSMPDMNPDFNISAFNNVDHPKRTVSLSEGSTLVKEHVLIPLNEPSFKKQHLSESCKEIAIKPKLQSSLNDKLQTVPASTDDPKRLKKNHRPQRSSDYDDNKDPLFDESATEKCVEYVHDLPHSSHNDHSDSDDDSEMDGEYSSDGDEDSEEETKMFSTKHTSVKVNLEKKRSRYFWQYNMQAKGPKGPKMKLTGKSSNVHDVPGVGDPIFSANCPIAGVKHSGKARRGDGNDLTPNPKKLHNIGKELEKLNCLIDGLIPVNELPVNARTKSRKEKNKLASRACRLKKKAQHEANKLKLFGLQEEQKYLLMLINEIKKLVKGRVLHFKQSKNQSIVAAVESLQMKRAVTKVAGCSADFVNNVLKSVATGDESGGLNVASMHEN